MFVKNAALMKLYQRGHVQSPCEEEMDESTQENDIGWCFVKLGLYVDHSTLQHSVKEVGILNYTPTMKVSQ